MYIWLIIFAVLLVIELITTDLVTIWFVIGSVAAFISTYFTSNIDTQIIIFIAVSLIALAITRPLVKKFKSKEVKTNSDMVLGKAGIVTKKITKDSYGEVKVNGVLWTAKSNKTLDVDTKVEVQEIDGVKLVVKEKEKD